MSPLSPEAKAQLKQDLSAGITDPAVLAVVMSRLDEILRDGRAAGVFRDDVVALDVHVVISSYCVFQVANRFTFGYLFDVDFTETSQRAHLRRLLGDMVVGWLTTQP